MPVCYRHPTRETGVSCSNCGNPICTDCMTATPVGMRCPDCSKQKTKVRTIESVRGGDPIATYVIMAICVLVFLGGGGGLTGSGGGPAFEEGALIARGLGSTGFVGVSEGQWWRLITYAFLHGGIIHIGFNMYILYYLGTLLEPGIGRARFVAIYVVAILGGALGALLLSPDSATVGASGGVFGLMGAAFVLQRAQGVDPMQSGIGPLILLNLGLSFVIANVSIGGHLGGLAAGVLAAFALQQVAARRGSLVVGIAICAVLGLAVAAAALGVAYAAA